MNKTIIILTIVILLLYSSSLVNAQVTMGKGLNKTANVQFESVQQRLLKGVDNVLKQLDKIIEKIKSNSAMPQEVKDQNIAVIETIKKGVLDYKTKIEQATTTSELTTASKELKKYLADNKDEIKAVLEQDKVYAAQQIQKKAEELKVAVEKALVILKVSCPNQKSDIELLEQKLTELETKSKELNELIKNKADSAQIKAKAKEVQALSKEVAKLTKKIKTDCGL